MLKFTLPHTHMPHPEQQEPQAHPERDRVKAAAADARRMLGGQHTVAANSSGSLAVIRFEPPPRAPGLLLPWYNHHRTLVTQAAVHETSIVEATLNRMLLGSAITPEHDLLLRRRFRVEVIIPRENRNMATLNKCMSEALAQVTQALPANLTPTVPRPLARPSLTPAHWSNTLTAVVPAPFAPMMPFPLQNGVFQTASSLMVALNVQLEAFYQQHKAYLLQNLYVGNADFVSWFMMQCDTLIARHGPLIVGAETDVAKCHFLLEWIKSRTLADLQGMCGQLA